MEISPHDFTLDLQIAIDHDFTLDLQIAIDHVNQSKHHNLHFLEQLLFSQ